MIVCIRGEEGESDTTTRRISTANNTLAEVFVPQGSPNSVNMVKHVVIVMDALKGFSREPLQWALDHVIRTRCSLTLLVSCKTMLDVWTSDIEDLSALKSRSDWKNEYKYQKFRGIIELCEQKGVFPCIKVAMGHPLRLVVLEQTTNLHATFVVLDRHLRKNKAFFAERLPSSVVIMKSDGEVDMLRVQSNINHSDLTPQESPITVIPTPEVILSEALSSKMKIPKPG
ncbi:uncharacterized protein LOC122723722 isoform X2 [Manihot esculenta]|uniref:uncharacterized protein LOC122723722 isoform X2 n=1 Tax=Manihot esculenta TaxID=3983 RepID=UPI001CC4D76B|nr:uncharacterized protein LOC122723722 isoform X2 [Manihot esculenta]